MADTTNLLQALQLSVGYPARKGEPKVILNSLDLTLEPGEFVCLVGPNGSGKSTLLRTLAGMQNPLAGSVLFQGQNLADLSLRQRAQRLALVLTRFAGVHGMSAFDSVALGRSPHTGWLDTLSEKDREQTLQAMQETDTIHLQSRSVDTLSDGERQRLAVARALAQEAQMIVLDEPTAFLDLPHRVGLMGLLRNLCRCNGKSVILSTHDLDLGLRFADRILVLDGAGAIDSGIPETLALRGTFGRVFSTPLVSFDLTTGSFKLEEEGCLPLSCPDTSIRGLWTRRALRRKGWKIEEDVYPKITLCDEAGAEAWRVQFSPQDERIVYQLEGVLDMLQQAKVHL